MLHEDSVGQCPECGANMSRTPDAPKDPNMELYAMRDRAMRERALESKLASRRNSGRVGEIDTGASPEVLDMAGEAAAYLLGLA